MRAWFAASLVSVLLGGCASRAVRTGTFHEGLLFRGDEVDTAQLRGRTVVYVLLDPACEMSREAAQPNGLLRDLDRNIPDEGTRLVLVGEPARAGSLSGEDFRAWIKDNQLRIPYVFDSLQLLPRRHRLRRTPWAVVVDPKGTTRFSGPAETMDEGGEYRLIKAVAALRKGLELSPGEPEGDGCVLDLR